VVNWLHEEAINAENELQKKWKLRGVVGRVQGKLGGKMKGVAAVAALMKRNVEAEKLCFDALQVKPIERSRNQSKHMLEYFELKKWDFFLKETEEIALKICARIELYNSPQGTMVLQAGDMTDRNTGTRYLHFLLRGHVQIEFTQKGKTVRIDNKKHNSMYGLAGVEANIARSAGVIASEDCIWGLLSQADYLELCKEGAERHEQAMIARAKDMRHWPLFNELTEERLVKAAALMAEGSYKKGDCVVREGDPLRKLIFIRDGECKLSQLIFVNPRNNGSRSPTSINRRPKPQKRELATAILGQHAIVGDVELVAGGKSCGHTCSVQSARLSTFELDLDSSLGVGSGAMHIFKVKFMQTMAASLAGVPGFERKLSMRKKVHETTCNVLGYTPAVRSPPAPVVTPGMKHEQLIAALLDENI
jgi:CRP-like cAMP-binding protein